MFELHSIRMTWPFMLWALAVLPMLVMLYAWLDLRAKRRPLLGGAESEQGTSHRWQGWWSRHGVAVWCLVGVSLMLLSLTRPRAVLWLPGRTEAVILVMDSSGSMRAEDVKPSRLHAAQSIAKEFVTLQPSHVKLGIVSAAATATVVQGPTDDRDALLKAIEGLSLQPGSAMGAGLLIGLTTLLPASGIDVNKLLNADMPSAPAATPLGQAKPNAVAPQVALDPGSNHSVALILLTDGQSNTGPDLLKMAQLSADRGVRVYTIGLGSPEGIVLKAEGFQARVKLDETPLKKVAEMTRGEYLRATRAEDVQRIYQAISSRIVMREHQLTEITALVGGLGLIWIILGTGWSFVRRGRLL